MLNVRDHLPEDAKAEWDAMTNFNFLKDFNIEIAAQPAKWNGHVFLPLMAAQTTQYAYEEWKPMKDDVFVVAFPKTGLHWFTAITRELLYGDNEAEMEFMQNIPVQLGCFEGGMPSKFKILDNLPLRRRLMSTHLPSTLLNVANIKKADAKVVYVVRNPKDQAVSWFKFVPKLPYLNVEGLKQLFPDDWSSFFDIYTNGKMPMGMRPGEWYPDHVRDWAKHCDDKNDLRTGVGKLAKFLNVEKSSAELDNIAEKCSFNYMKKSEENSDKPGLKLRKQAGILRKGGYGGWKEIFTEEQSKRMDEITKDRLSGSTVNFKYE